MKRWFSGVNIIAPGLIVLLVSGLFGWIARGWLAESHTKTLTRPFVSHPSWYIGSPEEDVYRAEGTPRDVDRDPVLTLHYYAWRSVEQAKKDGAKDPLHELMLTDVVEIGDGRVIRYENNSGQLHVKAPGAP